MDKEDKEVKEEEEEKKGRKREDKRPLLFKLHNTNEGDYWLFLHMSSLNVSEINGTRIDHSYSTFSSKW